MDRPAAALLYFCAPVTGVDGTSAYNDIALVFFVLSAVDLVIDREWFAASVCIGFCAAIKPTGLLWVAAFAVFLLVKVDWKAALKYSAVASAFFLPLLIRNLLLTGNPFAPLLNGLFPNPWFHQATETILMRNMRSYGGVLPWEIPLELTIHGSRLQGLLGPVFLLAPLALWSLRERAGRILLGLALILAAPWFLNIGTRFLLPALPFLSLALVLALSNLARAAQGFNAAQATIAIAILHAVSVYPAVAKIYAAPDAWMLRHLPWRAALRLEPERTYLHRALWSTAVADMVDGYAKPGEQVLDLENVPTAYVHWVPILPWQSAAADRAIRAVVSCVETNPFYELQLSWPELTASALKLQSANRPAGPWRIHEIELSGESGPLRPSTRWTLAADRYATEASLALDHNPATAYSTWEAARDSDYLEIQFGAPQKLLGARIVVSGTSSFALSVLSADGTWRRVNAEQSITRMAELDIRRSAMRAVRREGVGFILTGAGGDGYGSVGKAMLADPGAWGLIHLDESDGIHLFRVQ